MAFLDGTATQYPNDFIANVHLSSILRQTFNIDIDPWTVNKLPADDVDDLLHYAQMQRFKSKVDAEDLGTEKT